MNDRVAYVADAFRRAQEFMAEGMTRFEKFYTLYRAKQTSSVYHTPTRSKYVVPVCYKTVETILPRILSVIFSASPPLQARYRVQPMMSEGRDKIRNVDLLFDYFLDRHFFFETIQGWIKNALIYGQSYLKVTWKQRKRTKSVPKVQLSFQGQPISDDDLSLLPPEMQDQVEPMETEEEQEELLEDRLDVNLVDNGDLYFSADAKFPDPIGTAKQIVHVTKKRKSHLIAMKDAGLYLDFDESLLGSTMETDGADRRAQATSTNAATPHEEDPFITVYELWEDDWVIATADHKVLLRDEANPFGLPGKPKQKPFVACFDTLVPGEFFQVGEVEPLEHTQIEMSTLRRMRTDNNNLIINKMFVFDKDAEVDVESLTVSRPGGGVGCRPNGQPVGNVVQWMQQGDLNGASYREFQDLDKDGQEVSGLLDYAVGTAPERRETATTVQLLQTAANTRFDIKIRNVSSCFVRLGYMMLERWKQFQELPIPIRIPKQGQMGVEYGTITRDDLPEFDQIDLVAPGSPAFLMKDARHQKLMQMYSGLSSNPAANPMAALKLFVLALKEAELEGIEPIIQMLEMMPGMPPGMPGMPGEGMPPGNPGVNTNAPVPPSGPPMGGNGSMAENQMVFASKPER